MSFSKLFIELNSQRSSNLPVIHVVPLTNTIARPENSFQCCLPSIYLIQCEETIKFYLRFFSNKRNFLLFFHGKRIFFRKFFEQKRFFFCSFCHELFRCFSALTNVWMMKAIKLTWIVHLWTRKMRKIYKINENNFVSNSISFSS